MNKATVRRGETRDPLKAGDRVRVHWKIADRAPLTGVIRTTARAGFYIDPDGLPYGDDDEIVVEEADIAVLWATARRVARLRRHVAAA
ncbi:hypothetical protein [Pseudonocardia sp. D17]|uniref:hypothetical protein n=1 Tax=Pseudonocardia sp. D17 TaxID=882661 RepID=UPI002B3881ED|nr:hypothetical protein PSD17_06520 [Pseudonocardia sp. D17]